MTGVAAEGKSDNLKQRPRSAQHDVTTLCNVQANLHFLGRLLHYLHLATSARSDVSNIMLRCDAHLPLIAREASTTTRRRGVRWLIDLPPRAAAAARNTQSRPRVSSCLFTVEGVAQLCKHVRCCDGIGKVQFKKLQFLTCDPQKQFFLQILAFDEDGVLQTSHNLFNKAQN